MLQRIKFLIGIALTVWLALFTVQGAAQQLLVVTSPADGSLALEGQTITITVSADPTIQLFTVFSETPLPSTQPTAAANQFTLTIPTSVPAGIYHITAWGVTSTADVASDPITVDVERQDYPIAVEPEDHFLSFAPGQQRSLRVLGTFQDGSAVDLTNSSKISYSTTNANVATVDATGHVTAIAPGAAVIQISCPGYPAIISGAAYIEVEQPRPIGPAPVIASVTPQTGIPGVTQVTITGSGFGSAQSGGSLVLGTVEASQISSWSDALIVATVPANSRSGTVIVSQNGLWSNNLVFTISTPIIDSISPTRVAPGMQMAITGTGFGATQNGFVALGTTQGLIAGWSDRQILLTVPSGTSQGQLYVQENGYQSNAMNFMMIPPVIGNISPNSVIPGMDVTITGTGFGAVQNGFPLFGNLQANVVSWSDTQVQATVPQCVTPASVSVKQNGVLSNSLPFTTVPPTVTSASPTTIAPGMQMTITGTGFGTVQNGYVALGPVSAPVQSWTDNQIVVTVPDGVWQGQLYVQQNGATSNSIPFSTASPQISGLSPTTVAPGMQMTIVGSGFGDVQNGFVEIGNQQADITNWSDTQIVISVPPDIWQGQVYVQQNGTSSNAVSFSNFPPTISNVSPASTAPGVQITITGTGFGDTQNGFVAIGDANALVLSWSDTQIIAIPLLGSTSGTLYVQQNGLASASVPFTVTSNALVSITLNPGSSTVFGGRPQFQAIGTYSDGTTQDLTPAVTWTSSNPAVATVSNDSGTQGQATLTGFGTVTITATFGSVNSSGSLTVNQPPS